MIITVTADENNGGATTRYSYEGSGGLVADFQLYSSTFFDTVGSEIVPKDASITLVKLATEVTDLLGGTVDPSFQSLAYTSTLSVSYSALRPNKKIGILTGNIVITNTDTINGSFGQYEIMQDGTGGRTVTINGTVVPVNLVPSTSTLINWVFDGSRYTYHPLLLPTDTSYTFSPVGLPSGVAELVNSQPNIVSGQVGQYTTVVSGIELNYLIGGNSNWWTIGKLANGNAVVCDVLGTRNFSPRTVNSSGTLSGNSNIQSGRANLSVSDVARIKVAYNGTGDLTISYKARVSDTAWIVWATATASELSAAGFSIAEQRLGALMGVGTITFFEFQTKTGITVPVDDRAETPDIWDLFKKTYPWYNSRVYVKGDSITNEYNVPAGTYTEKLKAKLKAKTVIKDGTNGATLASGVSGSNGTISQTNAITDNLVPSNCDLHIILGGTNDFSYSAPLGDVTSILTQPTTTTVGALYYILNLIKTSLPESRIVVCTPTPRSDQDTPNTQSKRLIDYVDAIKAVSRYCSVPCLDLFGMMDTEFNITNVSSLYYQDGLHPTDKGYERLTDLQCKFINNLKV